jgi:hypothetical protein
MRLRPIVLSPLSVGPSEVLRDLDDCASNLMATLSLIKRIALTWSC